MKTIITYALLLLHSVSFSQNYQCFPAGIKHYFINNNGYIRGIRIDSVQSFADSTLFFPFHTPRGPWGTGLGGYYAVLDNNGGSWLGKKVKATTGGAYYFDNLRGDSTLIQTQAVPGESWIFYKDTGSKYYLASVAKLDTMPVLGVLDSVKTILLTARDSTGLLASDPLDSMQFLLSAHYGFVQICDLYTFPYHKPDSAWVGGEDFYLDYSLSVYGFYE